MKTSFVAMLLAGALLPLGCGERDRDRIGSEQPAVDAGEIAKRPDAFYGRPVTVVAEVEAVHGANAFTLDEDEAFAGPDVLVIMEKASRPIEEDREVMVEGTVRRLVVADLERDYPWFRSNSYDGEIIARFKERPVIVATMVRDEERGDVLAGAQRPAPVAPVN
jgi:hypothetical protein